MKTTILIIISIASAHSAPLQQVKESNINVDPAISKSIVNDLEKKFINSKISVSSLAAFKKNEVMYFAGKGKFYRVSAVVAHPETKHAALLEFVIYKNNETTIILPMTGDHNNFSKLLNFENKRIKNENDAIDIGKLYSSIYRIKLSQLPEITSDKNKYIIKLVTNDLAIKKSQILLTINIDADEKIILSSSKIEKN